MAKGKDGRRRPSVLFYERLHLGAAVFFALQIPVALATDFKKSLPYLVFLSLWALVAAHWSAWQATRSERYEREQNGG